MPSFWSLLISKVRAGEMTIEEAQRRDNYYSFAKYQPGIGDVRAYVLDAEYDSLPPAPNALDDPRAIKFQHFVEMVKAGRMCAYEAAQGYFDAVSG